MAEFFAKEGSDSHHCCFEWSIMVRLDDGSEKPIHVEAFEKREADMICEALNKYIKAEDWVDGYVGRET